MTAALEGGEWSAARPGRTLPPGKTRYPFYRRLCGPQGRSGRTENLVPTGIRSRTVQLSQSLYRQNYRPTTVLSIRPNDSRLIVRQGMSRSVVLQPAYGYHTTIATLQRNTNTHRTRYVEVQIQYSGDISTTCYTKHSITIRHHGSQYLRNTHSNTATRIKTNNALINSALTQYLYTSYRYNP